MSRKKHERVDITGEKIGKWNVIEKDINNKTKDLRYICRCECGNIKSVTGTSLNNGKSKSCGCSTLQAIASAKRTHGMSGTTEYNIWHKMKSRCTNKNEINYSDYGGRGITVCDRWINSFENFIKDMGKRPSPSHTIDRINNDDGYCPENCRWATPIEQASNKSNSFLINIGDITDTISGWARRRGINVQTLHQRIKRGMSPEDAITKGAPTFNGGVNDG